MNLRDTDFSRNYMRVSRARDMVCLAAAGAFVIGVMVAALGGCLGLVG